MHLHGDFTFRRAIFPYKADSGTVSGTLIINSGVVSVVAQHALIGSSIISTSGPLTKSDPKYLHRWTLLCCFTALICSWCYQQHISAVAHALLVLPIT